MDEFDNAEALAAQFQDRLDGLGGRQRRGGKDGNGRGGGNRRRGVNGGGGSSSSSNSRAVDVSRALSKLLRHQAASAGIPLDGEGYARLDRVLGWGPLRSMRVTLGEVREVVATNEKQRFALRRDSGDVAGGGDSKGDSSGDDPDDPAAWSIRANQGHSIPLSSDGGLLQPIVDADAAPAVVCHGTFLAAWPAIEAAGGLRPMGRNHVHCGCLLDVVDVGADVDVDLRSLAPAIPGLRKNAEVLVFLDVRRALREDPSIRWWRSANGVVLSEGGAADGVLPTRFFRRVVTTASPARTLWIDGVKVADLPPDLLARARLPPGQRGTAGRAAARARAGGGGGGEEKRGQGQGRGHEDASAQ